MWPTDVLSALGLKTSEIGLLGWIGHRFEGQQQDTDVYLPLGLRFQGQDSAQQPTLHLLLTPQRELEELYVSILRLDKSGKVIGVMQDGTALQRGYYPAARPLSIPLREVSDQGYYRIELGAELTNGALDSVALTFYHAGRGAGHRE